LPVAAIALDFATFRTNGRYAAAACAPILAEGTPMLAQIRAGIEALYEDHPREVRSRAPRVDEARAFINFRAAQFGALQAGDVSG
jgi:hypothetical protein